MHKQTGQVYADYYTVIPTINYYYYTMLDYYRLYYEKSLNGVSDKRLLSRIQGMMCVLYDLLKHYKEIADKKNDEKFYFRGRELEMQEVFKKFEMYIVLRNRMNFDAITIMKDCLVRCYNIMGFAQIDLQKEFERNYGGTY